MPSLSSIIAFSTLIKKLVRDSARCGATRRSADRRARRSVADTAPVPGTRAGTLMDVPRARPFENLLILIVACSAERAPSDFLRDRSWPPVGALPSAVKPSLLLASGLVLKWNHQDWHRSHFHDAKLILHAKKPKHPRHADPTNSQDGQDLASPDRRRRVRIRSHGICTEHHLPQCRLG